jgi:hypothetical protein
MEDDRALICPVCGVTMLAADQSACPGGAVEWVCAECEETGRTEDD